ncbi:LysE family transporter [Anaerotignum sp.]|uniref:LysE family transporter n=1 Tax=Anaerotignum sp. TaxID=2039241 RepID=UPI0027150067|nr:LysE family transporter [Anaerotignum sp.]
MFSWIHFLSYAIATAVTPGPNNIISMSNASRLGFRKSFPFNLGIWVGFSIVMLVCTVFCNTLSTIIPKIKMPMLIVGALYMLWLAWKTIRSSSVIEEDHSRSGFISGLTLQFVNPKIYIYCIVSMEAYILPFYHGKTLELVFFAFLLAFIGFIFTLCWALFGSAFKALFSKYAKGTNTIMALLLIYCAASLFL